MYSNSYQTLWGYALEFWVDIVNKMYCTAAEIIHARRNNKWCHVPFSKVLKIINSYPRVMICKTHELFFARDKVIYHKYSKHWPYLLASPKDCGSSKILNHCVILVFCCIEAWIQPDIFGCQQDFILGRPLFVARF